MTSTAPVLEVAGTIGERRGSWRRRFAIGAVAGLVLVLGPAGVALSRWDVGYDGHVLPGVHAGSVDLSGLDPAAAAATLRASFQLDRGTLILRTSLGDLAIPYGDVGRRLDTEATVAAALSSGRSDGPLGRIPGEVRQALEGSSVDLRVALDERALAGRITAALTSFDRPAEDPRVTVGPDGPVVNPARNGWRLDPAPAIETAIATLRRPDAPMQVVIEVAATPVVSKVNPDAVLLAAASARRMSQDVVVAYGKTSWTIPAATVRTWISFHATSDGRLQLSVDCDAVVASLDEVAKGIALKPQSAQFFTTRSGKVIGVMAARNGRRLDPEQTAARIVTELMTRGGGNTPGGVKIAITPVAPDLTTAEATQTAPLMTKLGSWKTWFPISERNYFGANIWRPAQIIDGTVLAPGQRFEWWSAIGPVTTARGFGLGGFIAGDHTEPTGAMGGGMCSSSTTLFNAALRAGLQMGARSNHRYYINRYPLGLDATVSGGLGRGQTMSFVNDTGHPILIRGIRTRSGGRGYVTYEIWGVSDGRTVTIGKPVVTNLRIATTDTRYVSTLPHGVRNQTEYPSNGMDVAVTRIVRDAAGRVIHSDTFRSRYVLWNGVILVGA